MRKCGCPQPGYATFQGKRTGYCRKCGLEIDERFTSNDDTMREWLARLADLPGVSTEFLQQCYDREKAGRDYFGLRFLKRDNASEALEEAADGANYCLFYILKARREGAPDKEDIALRAAYHFAMAAEELRKM